MFDKVTIVLTATDETKSLKQVVETVFEKCNIDDIGCILVVVPKNVTEPCRKTIEELEEKYPAQIRLLVQTHPFIGGAARDSIEKTESSHILFFSADIPANLECIFSMIEMSKKTPDSIIKISRWLQKGSFEGYAPLRLLVNFFAQKLLKIMFFSSLTDFTTPILIAPTKIYKNINFKEWNFPWLIEAVLIPVRLGFDIKEIAAKSYSRKEGKSKNSWLQTMLYLKTAIRIRFTPKKKLYKKDI